MTTTTVSDQMCEDKATELLIDDGDIEEESSYFDTLMSLNKILSFSRARAEIASCYVRRSRIYFRLEQYQKCLRNIELARQYGSAPELLCNLESKCVELISSRQYQASDFFQLSYPPHDENPAIVNCLKLSVNDKFGRHVVTTRRLKSGDVIAIEKPFYRSLDPTLTQGRCVNCLKSNLLDLTPCEFCTVMFCSKECEKVAWESFHKHECASIDDMTQEDGFLLMIQRTLFKALSVCGGDVEAFEKLIKESSNSVTAFDLNMHEDLSELEKKLILVCQSLESAPPSKADVTFASSFVNYHDEVKTFWKTNHHRGFLISFIVKFIGIMNRNGFATQWSPPSGEDVETGVAIFPTLSLVNHSCSPNLFRILVDDRLVFVVRKPIEPNEQLFISYHQLFHETSIKERQMSLLQQFDFFCTCEACENNYPIAEDLPSFENDFAEPPREFQSLTEAIEAFKRNCEYIDKNIEHYPCFEIGRLMESNCNILLTIASDEFLYQSH